MRLIESISKAPVFPCILKWKTEALLVALLLFGFKAAVKIGAPDFNVFYYAGRLVTEGKLSSVYVDSPDRFLYAPGCAVLFALLSFIPFSVGLAIWTALKAIGLVSLLPRLRKLFSDEVVFLSLVVVARPLLIDLRYGNLNSFLLILGMHFVLDVNGVGVGVTGIYRAQKSAAHFFSSMRSFFFGAFAFLKIIFLPAVVLGLLPIRMKQHSRKVASVEKSRGGFWSIFCFSLGVSLILALPLLVIPFTHDLKGDYLQLYASWANGLLQKGLPLETHNQSFLAFLFRIFGGVASRSLYLNGETIEVGWDWLSSSAVFMIFRVFVLGVIILASTLLWSVFRRKELKEREGREVILNSFLFLSLLWIPSHLIWKPYFLLGLPVVLIGMEKLWKKKRCWAIGALIALTLFTGVDVFGARIATVIEACNLQLWLYFVWIAIAWNKRHKSKG